MAGNKKSPRDVMAANVSRLIDLSEKSEIQLAKLRRKTAAKNINNARNGVNLSLSTLDGVAQTFGLQPWEILVPDLNVDKARLENAELVTAFLNAPKHIQEAVLIALGIRRANPDERTPLPSRAEEA